MEYAEIDKKGEFILFDKSFSNLIRQSGLYIVQGSDQHFFVSMPDNSKSRSELFLLGPGCILGFNTIHSKNWPSFMLPEEEISESILVISICLKGKCDLFLTDDTLVSLSDHRLVISTKAPKSDFFYRDACYDGLEFYIDPKTLETSARGVLSTLYISTYSLVERFQCKNNLYCHFTTPWIDQICHQLWQLQQTEKLEKMRMLSALLIHELLELPDAPILVSFLSRPQMDTVVACERLLCKDLSKRHTLQELAALFHVNHNSLKAHFKKVYGKSLTDYMTEKRVEEAMRLLQDTDIQIGEIAEKVGYENAGKFTAIFKRNCGTTPSEYRRKKLLELTAQSQQPHGEGNDT